MSTTREQAFAWIGVRNCTVTVSTSYEMCEELRAQLQKIDSRCEIISTHNARITLNQTDHWCEVESKLRATIERTRPPDREFCLNTEVNTSYSVHLKARANIVTS